MVEVDAMRAVIQRIEHGYHACRDGSGFRCWHRDRSTQREQMTESEAVAFDQLEEFASRPLGAESP